MGFSPVLGVCHHLVYSRFLLDLHWRGWKFRRELRNPSSSKPMKVTSWLTIHLWCLAPPQQKTKPAGVSSLSILLCLWWLQPKLLSVIWEAHHDAAPAHKDFRFRIYLNPVKLKTTTVNLSKSTAIDIWCGWQQATNFPVVIPHFQRAWVGRTCSIRRTARHHTALPQPAGALRCTRPAARAARPAPCAWGRRCEGTPEAFGVDLFWKKGSNHDKRSKPIQIRSTQVDAGRSAAQSYRPPRHPPKRRPSPVPPGRCTAPARQRSCPPKAAAEQGALQKNMFGESLTDKKKQKREREREKKTHTQNSNEWPPTC